MSITMAERLAQLPKMYDPIKEIVEIVDTTVQGLDSLDGVEDFGTRITAAEADIGTLETDLGTAEGKIEALEGKTISTYLAAGQNEITENGAIAATDTIVILNKADGALETTLAAPAAGRFLIITQQDAGTSGHTVTLTAGTFDGTNEIATFNAAGETLILYGISDTRFLVLLNEGSVAFSTAG